MSDLANLVSESILISAKLNKKIVTRANFEYSCDKDAYKRQSLVMAQKEKKQFFDLGTPI